MEWKKIRGFYFLAKSGSFTKAAESTFRTQSAVSQQIKGLEEEFGCKLIERIGKHRLRITPYGEKFLEFSEKLLEYFDTFTEEINILKGLQIGRFKLAAPFTTLYHLIPSVLKCYAQRFPNVLLTILDRPQKVIIDLIHNGDIDIGLLLESVCPKNLSLLRWKRVESVLMVPKNHPLAGIKKPALNQLAEYPLIMPPANMGYRNELDEMFQQLEIIPKIIMESSNVELSSTYVEMGFGISFATVVNDLPEFQKRELAFIPMSHVFKPDHIVAAMRKDKSRSLYLDEFIKILFEQP